MNKRRSWQMVFGWVFFAILLVCPATEAAEKVTVNWEKVQRVSQTTPTLQVVVNPPLRRGSAIHDRVFRALRDVNCDYVRYVPWYPYPKLGVAELKPPRDGKTSWDFSLIDPLTIDFLNATEGHPAILNFSTIPQWMFKTPKPVPYPADPNQVSLGWTEMSGYGHAGTEFRDPTLKEVADYYARLVSWYTKGGFTDEYGQRHESGYHYKIDYWEVLNEDEHSMTPQTYTRVYDAVVEAIRRVDSQIKFIGLGGGPTSGPQFSEYFLNSKNHKPGIPLDMVSYHFYAVPTPGQTPETWQYTFFDQADGFLRVVRYLEAVRDQLAPQTGMDMDEIGTILPYDTDSHLTRPIPNSYWNLSGALYAYLYVQLAHLGVEVAGESQMVGYPTQFPSVSMVDWNTGQPNARYWVLKLLRDNFSPGDKLVETTRSTSAMYAQGFLVRDGKRKVLLINKRDRPQEISLPGATGAREEYVDQETAFNPPGSALMVQDSLTLGGFEVAVLTLP